MTGKYQIGKRLNESVGVHHRLREKYAFKYIAKRTALAKSGENIGNNQSIESVAIENLHYST